MAKLDLKMVATLKDKASKGLGKLNSKLAAVGKAAAVVGTAIAAGTGATIKFADAIGKAADRAGLSTDALQELRHAASLAGVSTQQLDDGMRRLNRRFGEFVTTGGGPAGVAFKEFGIAAKDAEGNVRPTEEVLKDVIAVMGSMESQAEKAAFAAKAFGDDAGPQLALALGGGLDAVTNLRNEAQKLGLVLSEEMIRNAEKAGDQMGILGDVVRTKLMNVFGQLIPTVSAFVSYLTQIIPQIESFFVNDVYGAVKYMFSAFEDTIIEQWARDVITAMGPVGNFFKAFFTDTKRLGIAFVDVLGQGFFRLQSTFKRFTILSKIKFIEMVNAVKQKAAEMVNTLIEGYNLVADKIPGLGKIGLFEIDSSNVDKLYNDLRDVGNELQSNLRTHRSIIDAWNDDLTVRQRAVEAAKESTRAIQSEQYVREQALAANALATKLADEAAKKAEESLKLAQKQAETETDNRVKEAAREKNRLIEEGKSLTESLRTEQEQLNVELEKAAVLYQAGTIDLETYTRVIDNTNVRLGELAIEGNRTAELMANFWSDAARNMEGDMSNFFFDAMQGNFTNLAQSFKQTIDRMVADLLASQLMSFLTSGVGGGALSGVGNFLSGMFRAEGGPVSAGKPYIVGEVGPELFVPNQSGSIVSNKDMAGGGSNVNITIHAIDSQDVRRTLEKERRWLAEMVGGTGSTYNLRGV